MSVIARNFLRSLKPKRDIYSFASNTVTWGELLCSDIAERDGEMQVSQMNPPDQVLENLLFLATSIIDIVRVEFGRVTVVSGYRCPKLQDVVRAPRGSAITKGLGAELRVERIEDIRGSICSNIGAELGDRRYEVSPSWYLAMWLTSKFGALPIESISVDGGAKGKPSWVTVSAHPNPEHHRGAITAFGPWTGGETVKLHQVDLRSMGVL